MPSLTTSAARTAMRATSSSSSARLSQMRSHLSTNATSPMARNKEVGEAYIISAARTPTAKFNGSFMSLSAPQLGAVAIKSAIEKSKVPIAKITDVYMGNVLAAGVGQAPARQASIFAGLPPSVEAVTINKVCASGLKAVAIAAQNIQLGLAEAQVAGGMESMSRVPYYLPRAAQNPAFGHMQFKDGLIEDGLWDVYNQFHMGNCAENTAKKFKISREAQDEYAIRSFERAQKAWAEGKFKDEIVPVTVKGKKGDTIISEDEGYQNLRKDKVASLKPAFVKGSDGSVTAANSSTFNDGASALVLGSKAVAQEYGQQSRVLARIISSADAATDPIDFTIAPSKAVPIALERAGLKQEDIAIWEFNEAFAAVIKANEQILGLENANVNLLGGAISLGHALGSSGSRILTTLLHQLKPGEYGCAAICNGGGAATAMIVQRIERVE
ncbi:acetyl-CoA C-acetyltransferase [Cladophialophora yegresii CBS 114405]|uniref:acetyl-CoA C-acetyltransferase n=1 Tax=Cladophialophora yegresii CBS 114405 TaxID=1182544 RepID=W9VYM8_9EURO|nr:acetyl-CoA C-acetyltransferase [Cladophialophora yegresii CBS 114405]EXJ57331.1 acetyl-CoA C-acetyltransferase [Cladophialophora yegresii CBS 114405]